jgi:hypothetical protein
MKKISSSRALKGTWRAAIASCLLATFVAFVPLKTAHAYVDPNAAGPLFQFLFPAIIAITSAIAGFRRQIARLWSRLMMQRSSGDVPPEPAGDGDRTN